MSKNVYSDVIGRIALSNTCHTTEKHCKNQHLDKSRALCLLACRELLLATKQQIPLIPSLYHILTPPLPRTHVLKQAASMSTPPPE